MTPTPESLAAANATLTSIRAGLSRLFVGQSELVDGALIAVVGGGHVLVESLPGLGKTLLVKALGILLGLRTNRIQFTPDLMPSDITGSHVFDLAERRFIFHHGPVFCQFLLGDELNRAPAKTHAALLEVMQERQVTLDGKRYPVDAPFLVMATANPIENEGTYALPEAALDRFLVKLVLSYPGEDEERRILALHLHGGSPDQALAELRPVTDANGVIELQRLAASLTVSDDLIAYIAAIVRKTRSWPGLHLGASPRAGVALLSAARARALLHGRAFVIPDDVAELALPALRHRVILNPEAEVEGRTADAILEEVVKSVQVPRGIAPHE